MADAPLVGEPLAERPIVDLVVDLVVDLDLTVAGGGGLISACGQLEQPIGARVCERAAEGGRAWIGGETADMSGLPGHATTIAPGDRMPRKRVAVLISGRGSNMAALIEAAKAADFPAEIALVLANRPDAAGLRPGERRGSRPRSSTTRTFGKDREAFERALQAALEEQPHRSRLPRRLHAPADALVRRPLGGAG